MLPFAPTTGVFMQRLALSLLAISAFGSAWAGPQENVHDAFAKFLAAKTFRATVTDVKNGEQLSAMEFVAPDRYHMHNAKAGADTIIIGNDGWMNVKGQLMKMPIPVGKIIGQFRNDAMLRQKDLAVTDL